MDRIKVLVASGSQIYALGLIHSLIDDERIEVYNHTYSEHYVIEMAGQVNPDIILIDFELLNRKGDRVPEILQEIFPEVKVIVLIPPENIESFLDNAINAGVRGILPETINPVDLVKSIIDTAQIGAAIHPTLIPLILKKLTTRLRDKPAIEHHLSDREREILELVAKGKTNREIAESLFVSENTVKGHVRRICYKLNIENRVEMARYMLLNKNTAHKENDNE